MQPLGSGLDDHGHRSGGRSSIFRTVVRSQSAKLGDGLHGRCNVRSAPTPTIGSFAAINYPQVMRQPLTVETHVEVAASRSGYHEVRLCAGSAGRHSLECEDAATIGGQLADLSAGDHAADFSRVGLHRDGVRLNSDVLGCGANLHGKVHTQTVTDGENQASFLSN